MPFLSPIAPLLRPLAVGLVAVAMLVLGGCSDDLAEIEIVREPGPTLRKPAPLGLTPSERLFGPQPLSSKPLSSQPWSWDAPIDWIPSQPRDSFTLALYQVGRAEVSVSFLGGDPKVEQNVNRWRGQFADLKPLTPDEIRTLPRRTVMGREAVVAEMTGTYRGRRGTVEEEGHGLVAAIIPVEQGALFVRMVGPAALLEARRGSFDRFLASFRAREGTQPAAAHTPPSPPAPESAAQPEPRIAWTTPEGWTEHPPSGMRLATFTPKDHADVECTLFEMAAGGLAENVNLWRAQMGAEPITAEEVAALPTVKVLGADAPLVEVRGSFIGKRGQEIEGALLLGLICPVEDRSVFVKMVGPAEVVEAERERFIDLVRSLRLQT